MDSEKITFIMVFTLLVICRLNEGKGLCEYEEMFSSKGKTSSIQRKTSKDEEDNVIMQSTIKTTTLQQVTSAIVTPETNGSILPSTLSALTKIECPPNKVYGNCGCQISCDDPTGRHNTSCECMELEICVCVDGFLKKGDDCVTPSACGCYISDDEVVIPNNETYINTTCDGKCICRDDQLVCNSSYRCSPYAACNVLEDVRQCYCNEGYHGDGEVCIPYKDCYEIFQAGSTEDGVYTIIPDGWPLTPFEVFCDMQTSGGGWTVFQRRMDGVTDFNRSWESYKSGFGSVHNGSDFWLGNEQLHYLTLMNNKKYKLRIDIVPSGGSLVYEEYSDFVVEVEFLKYMAFAMHPPNGTAGDAFPATGGLYFSTYDQDNDMCDLYNCAEEHGGAWWHGWLHCHQCYNTSCNHFQPSSNCTTRCTDANLNGHYNRGNGEGLFWQDIYCNLTSVEMKIRPFV